MFNFNVTLQNKQTYNFSKMRTINIKKLIGQTELDFATTARRLFPRNKYPELALHRVIKGKAMLDTNQISILSELTGLTISELFSSEKWTGRVKNGIHIYKTGNYRAELNPETGETKVFHVDELFHETIIHSKFIALKDYISKLEQIIEKYEADKNEQS